MKLSGIRIFIICILSFISLEVIISCKDQKAGQNRIILAHDKGTNPNFQPYFLRQSEKAKEALGLGFEPVSSATVNVYMNQMEAVLPTKESPQLFTWWSTYRVKELVDKDLVADMTRIWDKYNNQYPPALRSAFSFNNKVYGFPYLVEYWAVWYNKKIFNDLNLKEPATWSEFIGICETLKGNKITPVLLSLQNQWPGFIWFEEMLIGEDPDLYVKLCEGKIKYSDPRIKKALRVWKDMIDRGFFTKPSVNMFTNAGHLWKNKKFGMVLCGSWYYSSVLLAQGVEEESIGVFILPPHNSSAGKNIIIEALPIFVAKNAAHREASLKLAEWWMGAEGNGNFAKLIYSYPGNIKSDLAYLTPVKKKLIHSINSEQYRVMNRYWEATPPVIAGTAVNYFGKFILNTNTLDSSMAAIDRIADKYWAEKK